MAECVCVQIYETASGIYPDSEQILNGRIGFISNGFAYMGEPGIVYSPYAEQNHWFDSDFRMHHNVTKWFLLPEELFQ